MPRLTVKAFAELIHTPLYGQLRILNEQKYPSQAPGTFKIQYYRPALQAVRRYYRQANNMDQLPTHGHLIPSVGTKPDRIQNNLRAINAFRRSSHRNRMLSLLGEQTWDVNLANVTLKATPDLAFTEGGNQGFMIVDCRLAIPEQEIIRTTLELLHHTLSANGVTCPMRRIEYLHLETDTLCRWNSPRQTTVSRANQTATAIQTLWDSI